MAIRCRFVDSISATPSVRLDLNAGDSGSGLWLGKGGLHCPPPPLRRAEADSILWDGGTVAASAYGNRDLGLPISFRPGTMDLRNAAVSALIKELNRETNILEYRPDGSSTSYFFRTFRSPNFDPTLWLPKNPIGMINVDLYAEPFAYGLRVDQTPVSVKMNPAVTNGCYLDVNGVTGDVATPAYVQLYSAAGAAITSPSYLSVRRHGIPANLGFVYQAEAGAGLGSGTTVTASNDASASGAGNNTLTSTGSAIKPNFYITPSEGVEIRGTYRVLVRAAKTVFADEWQLGVNMSSDFSNVNWVPVVSNVSGYTWTDVGLISLPGGEDVQTGYSGVSPNVSTTIRTYFASNRVSGTGSLLWDVIILLPADENLVVFKPTAQWSGGSTSPLVLDGPNDAVYPLVSSATFNSTTRRAGSIPLLAPGNNRLFFVENITTATLNGSSTVAVSYWPRYLTV